jgi:ATP-binding cassette subfamily C protein
MIRSVVTLLCDVSRVVGWRLPVLLVLTLASAIFEGLTLALLLPLLTVLGGGGGMSGGADSITHAIRALLDFVTLPLTLQTVATMEFAAIVLSATAFVLQALMSTRMQAEFVTHWQERVFGTVMESSWQWLRRQRAGDIVGALTTESARLAAAFFQVNLIVSSILFLIAQTIIATAIAPAIVFAIVLLATVLFVSTRAFNRRAFTYGEELTNANADLYGLSGELMGGMKLVKATAQEEQGKQLVGAVIGRIRFLSFHTLFDIEIVRAIFNYVSATVVLGMLIVGDVVFGISVSAIMIVVAMFLRLFPKVTALRQCLQSFGVVFPAYVRLRELTEQSSAAREVSGKAELAGSGPAAIVFRRAEVLGDEGDRILGPIDLDIPVGALVALVGPTGAGKTTLVDCVLGLARPSSGDVLIDGVAVDTLDLQRWRHSIGYLGQDPVLFAGSIRDNVCWGRPFEDSRVVAALMAADAHFALRLPESIDSMIGERGGTLSGGERQRIALARALLGDPRMLILDEVTSALDPETERRVADAVRQRRGQTTVIAITHRLSTLSDADLVVMLEKGCVVASGTLDELRTTSDRFLAFWQTEAAHDLSIDA